MIAIPINIAAAFGIAALVGNKTLPTLLGYMVNGDVTLSAGQYGRGDVVFYSGDLPAATGALR